MDSYEVYSGTVVRVSEGPWKTDFAGMRGTIQERGVGYVPAEAAEVLLDDGSLRFFWLRDLAVVNEEIVDQQFALVVVEHESIDGHNGFKLPFGYHLKYDADLLIVRRSDGSFATAFNASNVDGFEIECAVWEDADQLTCGRSVDGYQPTVDQTKT